jgi:hypothetical protein
MVSFGTWLLLGILTIVIIIFSVNPQLAPIFSDLTLQKVLTALGGIFVIVLLVERAMEIVISIWRQAPTDQLKEELSALMGDPAKAADATAKAKELAKYQAETKGLSLLVGFALSIVVCSAGVGLLGEIIDITKGNKYFLRGVDIVLTSGLIAGGSDAFHQFVRAIETFFTKSKEKMQKP